MKKREKIRAQMKSRFYYLFWGAMAGAVVGGQIYVGTSYLIMAKSMNRWFDETIDLIQQPIKPPTGRMVPIPMPTPDYYDNPMIIR